MKRPGPLTIFAVLFICLIIAAHVRSGGKVWKGPERLPEGTRVIMFDGREGVVEGHGIGDGYHISYTDKLGKIQTAYLHWNKTFTVKKAHGRRD